MDAVDTIRVLRYNKVIMFKKEKSLTLKILNAVFVLQIVGLLVASIVWVIQIIFPTKYVHVQDGNLPIQTFIEEVNGVGADVRVIITILLLICVVIAALFVCNKCIRNFQVEKSSGLKLLTAISAMLIVEIASAIISAVVYESLAEKTVGVLVVAIVILVLAPFISDSMHILDARHARAADMVNAIMIVILTGIIIALINTLIYADSYDCGSKYYCDQNSFARTVVTEVVLTLFFGAIIYIIKRRSDKDQNQQAKIITMQSRPGDGNLRTEVIDNFRAGNDSTVIVGNDINPKNESPMNNSTPAIDNDFTIGDEGLHR